MSSRIIMLLALLCSGACIAAPALSPLPDSVQRMYIYGASAPAPQDKGWFVVPGHDGYHVDITKLGSTKDATIVIAMQDYKLSPAQPGEDFAALIKEGQDKASDPSRFTQQVHDVVPFKLGEAICARSHEVSVDKVAKTPTGETTQMLVEAYALNCRHPDQPLMGINVTYSLRYHEGDRDPQLEQVATAVLDGVQILTLKK